MTKYSTKNTYHLTLIFFPGSNMQIFNLLTKAAKNLNNDWLVFPFVWSEDRCRSFTTAVKALSGSSVSL